MTNRTHILACICLLIALGVLGFIMQSKLPARFDLPFETESTIFAAEFAATPDEVNAVLATDHRYSKPLIQAQYLDFPFIACYAALFILVARALTKYDVPAARQLSWIAIGSTVAAAGCDIGENLTIIKTATNGLASSVRYFSTPKWALVFLVMAIESLVFFFWPRLTLWWRVGAIAVGGLFLFVGASGLLFSALYSISDIGWSASWISTATGALLVFLIAILVRNELAARARARWR